MVKARVLWILASIAAASCLCAAATATATNATTIYDELRAQGLPVGLLPKGIAKYWLNGSSGEFEVWMNEPCNAKFENEVHYDSNIKGILGFGRIGELSGVSAQELFLWFPVKGIRVDVPTSGLIHFDVGVADKQFSLSLFEDPPDCSPQVNVGSGKVLLFSALIESIVCSGTKDDNFGGRQAYGCGKICDRQGCRVVSNVSGMLCLFRGTFLIRELHWRENSRVDLKEEYSCFKENLIPQMIMGLE
ncbi:hypothetical protein Fmac_017744 [Flemingia macrophylla]|uniref:Uncharacterized protein n=1 Tax=Flemingia macrophylla TaxID=520843 RepID=A0ABD1M328_9FABA